LRKIADRFLIKLIILLVLFLFGITSSRLAISKPKIRAQFYDFSEQLIDGEVKKPQALYTDVRQAAEFKRLLKLKKSFIKNLFDDARMPVFK